MQAGVLQQVTNDREASEGTAAWPRREDKAHTRQDAETDRMWARGAGEGQSGGLSWCLASSGSKRGVDEEICRTGWSTQREEEAQSG